MPKTAAKSFHDEKENIAQESNISNSLHSNDVITDDMTLEKVFQLWQNKAIKKIDDTANESILELYKKLEETKKELWDAHETALSKSKSDTPSTTTCTTSTTIPFQEQTQSYTKEKCPVRTINVTVQHGPHEGSTFALRPTSRSPSYIGRSTGKKFVQKGISLQLDNQVSTTHGKFTLYKGLAYFTDTGSTNGSLVKGEEEELQVNEKLELKEGMILVMGNSELLIGLGHD